PRGPEHPEADLVLVGAQVEDEVIVLAREDQRPEGAPLRVNGPRVGRGRRGGRGQRDLGDPARTVDRARNVAVADRVARDGPLERREPEPARARRPAGARRELPRALGDDLGEARAWHDFVHQPPLDGALALDAFLGGAEEVGAVAAYVALVHEPREPA